MTAPLVLVVHPAVYTDGPDDLPELLNDVEDIEPDVIVITMPRGMAAPRRLPYLTKFADDLRIRGYTVDHREVRINGIKQRVVIGQHVSRGRHPAFVEDFGQLILANQ